MSYYVITPHLPKRQVGLMAIGKRYAPRLAAPLEKLGVDVLWLPDAPDTDSCLAGHADLSMIHLGAELVVTGCGDDIVNNLTNRGFKAIRTEGPGKSYPEDCTLNACIVGSKLIHRLDVTSRTVLGALPYCEKINVAQGYAKCCTCVVDERSIITSDRGIAAAASDNDIDVLLIAPGYIELEGFDYGFIGGASFKLSADTMAFTGRLDAHPDYHNIICFLTDRGIRPVFLTSDTAFDIGSALPLTEV